MWAYQGASLQLELVDGILDSGPRSSLALLEEEVAQRSSCRCVFETY